MTYGCLAKVRIRSVPTKLYQSLSKEVKPDIRNTDARPPVPINDDLNELLVQLESVNDPFLLFL